MWFVETYASGVTVVMHFSSLVLKNISYDLFLE